MKQNGQRNTSLANKFDPMEVIILRLNQPDTTMLFHIRKTLVAKHMECCGINVDNTMRSTRPKPQFVEHLASPSMRVLLHDIDKEN